MSGVAAQALSHVVRRGLEHMPTTTDGLDDLTRLDFSIFTLIPVAVVLITTIFLICSVDYTVGSVMASLTMIESPSTTTIVETAPPAYSDEPDAPLEKKMDVADVEVVVIDHKPITASVVGTIKHLHRIGGFRARWRGLGWSIIYHFAVNFVGHLFGGLFSGVLGHILAQGLGYTLSVVLMCRLHMVWTHAMIATPTSTSWSERFIPRKQCKPLLLASLNYAVAQQSIIVLPAMLLLVLSPIVFAFPGLTQASTLQVAFLAFHVVALPTIAILAALFIYLPAASTLARVEACLLPQGRETIVPFDRMAIVGDLDLNERGSAKKLNAAAWKSFTNATRLRLVKLFVKLVAFQVAVILVSLHVLGAIAYFSNPEQVSAAFRQLSSNMPW
ncbi:hypothetical protein AMS68_003303 [Peltaster fructicola]|uniref:Uncharacterized protein n=1 Tax=Peltaster fructicola TaxID=286661 RepID=A0A6H0XSY6_9PEZI|nr:hypothetical protein AMS68_003303 [Peltaster fructicola]